MNSTRRNAVAEELRVEIFTTRVGLYKMILIKMPTNSQPLGTDRTASVAAVKQMLFQPVKANFHYAIQLANQLAIC